MRCHVEEEFCRRRVSFYEHRSAIILRIPLSICTYHVPLQRLAIWCYEGWSTSHVTRAKKGDALAISVVLSAGIVPLLSEKLVVFLSALFMALLVAS